MKKIAVFFPGIGYTVDKPLLYYSRKIVQKHEYEIKLLQYGGFPENIRGNKGKMMESYDIAMSQTTEMLADIDWSQYQEILFIGKSIGTIVAANVASNNIEKEKIKLVLYTPLEQAFQYKIGKGIVFTGMDDPWVGGNNSIIPQLCEQYNMECIKYEGANHSLETDDYEKNLEYLLDVMKKTEQFITE